MSDLRSEAVERAARTMRSESITAEHLAVALHMKISQGDFAGAKALVRMLRDSLTAIEKALEPPPF